MDIVMLSGFTLICAVLSLMLKKQHPEYSIVISAVAGALIIGAVLAKISPAIMQINRLVASANLSSDYAAILFKSLGICFLAQFSSDACADAGEVALSSKIEFAGKVMIVITALPLFEKVIETAVNLLGGK